MPKIDNDNKQFEVEKSAKNNTPYTHRNGCITYNIDEERSVSKKIEQLLAPIDIKQMPKIEAIRHKYKNELSQYSFDILYLWKEKMGYRVYIEDDFFVVKYDFGGENAWLFPCGAEDKIYRFICEKVNEKDFRLCGLRDTDITWLIEHFPDIWEVEHMEDVDEYVCDISEYLSLNGSKYSDIRTKIRKIDRKMKVYSKPLTDENISDALRVIKEWENMPHFVGVGGIVDDNESEIAIAMYKELNISGIVSYVDNEPIAVFAGAPLCEDTVDLLVAKVNTTICNSGFFYGLMGYLKSLPDAYKYCNMEDDLGIIGLRSLKRRLRPAFMNKIWDAKRR